MQIYIGKVSKKNADGTWKSFPSGHTMFVEKDQSGNTKITVIDNRTESRVRFWPLEDRNQGAGYGGGQQPQQHQGGTGPLPVSGPRPAPVDVPQGGGWQPTTQPAQPSTPAPGQAYDPDQDDVPF